jgi:hypothetical protein
MEILGSGGFGLVVSNENKVIKLYYDINDCKNLFYESQMQRECRKIVNNIRLKSNKYTYLGINIPKVYGTYSLIINIAKDLKNFSEEFNKDYLCGISMERIFVPKIDGFKQFDCQNEQIHLGLGLHKDYNQSWICNNGVSRGFYANTEMIETILEEFPHQPEFTMENIAFTLGVVYRTLIDNHIKPFDVEITLGIKNNKLTLNMIDFNLCEKVGVDYLHSSKKTGVENPISHDEYYFDTSYKGLFEDLYVPHINRNDKYSQDFYNGYFKN